MNQDKKFLVVAISVFGILAGAGIILFPYFFPPIPPAEIIDNRSTHQEPISGPVIIVASNDCSEGLRSQTEYICDGINDEVQINAAIDALGSTGGTVILTDGTYNCGGNVVLKNHSTVKGQGSESSTLNFVGYSYGVRLGGINHHMTLADLRITGKGFVHVTSSNVLVKNVLAYQLDNSYRQAFLTKATTASAVVTDVEYLNCRAIDCNRWGFVNDGPDGTVVGGMLTDIRFIGCKAINSGRYKQYLDGGDDGVAWDVGFDIAEVANVDRVLYQDCLASGSWESGFHTEFSTNKKNVRLVNCVSRDNNQKEKSGWAGKLGKSSYWGAGFIVSGDMELINCISENNKNGYYCYGGGGGIENSSDAGSKTGILIRNIQNAEGLHVRASKFSDEEKPVHIIGTHTTGITLEKLEISSGASLRSGAGITVVPSEGSTAKVLITDARIYGYRGGIRSSDSNYVSIVNVTLRDVPPSTVQETDVS